MRRLLFFTTCLISLFSCKKTTPVGSELIDSQNRTHLSFVDSITVYTKTIKEDSLQTNNNSLYLLGNMDDPAVFGKSVAGIFTQFLLPSNSISLGKNLTLDSAVLSLDYRGFYGDKNVLQTVSVYELSEEMLKNTSYYSDKRFGVNAVEIGRKSDFTPIIKDSIVVFGVKKSPHLRIRLDNSFGTKILQADSSNFTNNTAFLKFFKGLYIAPDSTKGNGIMSFKLRSPVSKLTLYYKSQDKDSLSVDFLINDEAVASNHYHHNRVNTLANRYLNNTNLTDTVVLLQGMAGLKNRMSFPFIEKLTSIAGTGKILINRAELIVSAIPNVISDTSFAPPVNLILSKSKDFSDVQSITEKKIIEKDSKGNLATNYHFIINNYLQNIFNKSQQNELYLGIAGSKESSEKGISGGGKHSVYKIVLKLNFTKI